MSKKKLLESFRKEYVIALKEDGNADDHSYQDAVIDKYMNMDTEEFDSDDLNEIIDEVQTEHALGVENDEDFNGNRIHYAFIPQGNDPVVIEESSLEEAKDLVEQNYEDIHWKQCSIYKIETTRHGGIEDFKVLKK